MSFIKKVKGKVINQAASAGAGYVWKTAKNAAAYMINKMSETKMRSVTSAGFSNVSSTGDFTELTTLSQGATETTRVGDQVLLRKLYFQRAFALVPNASISNNLCRMLVVQSKSGPLVAGDMPTNPTANCDVDKMYVLYDKIFSVYATVHDGTNFAGGSHVTVKKKIKFSKPTVVEFNDATTAARKNGIYIYLIASSAGAVKSGGFEQIYYKDR